MALAWAAGETESSAASMTVAQSARAPSFSRSLPPMIRETSRMSSISCDCAMRVVADDADGPLDHRRVALARRQQVRPAENRVQRRAQLVRQRGEELVLQAIDGLGVGAGALLALEQHQPLGFDALPLVDLVAQRRGSVSASSRVRARTRSSSSSCARSSACAWRLSASRFWYSSTNTATFDLQDLRAERLEEVVDRADRVAAEHVRVAAVVGGQEDDRRLPAALAAADQLGGLVAVEVRHGDVEQDQREVAAAALP